MVLALSAATGGFNCAGVWHCQCLAAVKRGENPKVLYASYVPWIMWSWSCDLFLVVELLQEKK